ncbi:MAG: hypothetical protein Kow0092_06340 [Deferrisomatales bacterium]
MRADGRGRGKTRWARRVVWAAALGALAGCSGGGLHGGALRVVSGFASEATPYGQALETYTRGVELYEGVGTLAKGWATWWAPELRRAYAEASVKAYRLDGEEAAALRRDQERAARTVREFHVALYTPQEDWNDLEAPDSLWKPFLELPDGERLEPVRIVHLPKSDKASVEYPYVTRWTREYSLFFPLAEGREVHEHLTLVLSGRLGTLEFRF